MGKININTQVEPTDTPDTDKSFLYIDSDDDILTSKSDDGTISKYITSTDIPLSWLDSAKDFLDFTTSEPASPSSGDRYINTVTGTSSVTTQSVTTNYVYEWSGSTWIETVVEDGDAIIISDPDPNEAYIFNGAAWVNYGSTTNHNTLAGLQGGTTDEYYHLTSADESALTDVNAQLTALHTDGSPSFTEITTILSATSSLADGVTGTTQSTGDDSTKIATTAYVEAAVLAEDFWDRSGTTLSPSTSGDNISIDDNASILLGDGNDLAITHNGTSTSMTIGTGGGAFLIENQSPVGDIKLKLPNNTGGTFFEILDSTDKILLDLSSDGFMGLGTYQTGALINFHIATGDVTSGLGGTPSGRGMAISGLSDYNKIYFESTDATTGQRVFDINNGSGILSFGSLNDTASTYTNQYILALDHNTGTVSISGDLAIDTDIFYVDSVNDRVGIGTSTPGAELEIEKDDPGTVIWQRAAEIVIENTNTLDGAWAGIQFMGAGSGIAGGIGTKFTDTSANIGDLYLSTRNADTSFNTNHMVLTEGKVGIGTNTPSTELEISNLVTNPALTLTGNLSSVVHTAEADYDISFTALDAGNANMDFVAIPSDGTSPAQYRFGRGNGTTGPNIIFLYEPNSTTVQTRIASSGFDTFFNNEGGNFGIGTNIPLTNFHVLTSGTSGFGSTPVDRGIAITGIGGQSRLYFEATDATSSERVISMNNEDGILNFGSLNDDAAAFINENILALELSTGYVGIGTSSPGANLDIVTTDSDTVMRITADDTYDTVLRFFQNGSTKGIIGYDDSDDAIKIGYATTLGDANSLVIDSSGNVGIGTSNPSSLLDIENSDSSIVTWSRPGEITIKNPDTTDDAWSGIEFQGSGSGIISAGIAAQYIDTSLNYADLIFSTRGASGFTRDNLVLSDGKVGVGAVPTKHSLEVSEGMSITNRVYVNSIDDLPDAVGGVITLAEQAYYVGDDSTTLTLTDELVFGAGAVMEGFTITTDSNISGIADIEFRDSVITFTGTGDFLTLSDASSGSRFLRTNLIMNSSGSATCFNFTTTSSNIFCVIDNVGIIGFTPFDMGTMDGMILISRDAQFLFFNAGLSLVNNDIIDIGTLSTVGVNTTTTHLSIGGTTQGAIQITGYTPTIQSNESAIDFDTSTTYESVSVIGCVPKGVTDNFFESGSYDTTTVGFKFVGNTWIPDSTSNAYLNALDQSGVQTLLDQNVIQRINATFTEQGVERFSTDSAGTIEYLGNEEFTSSLLATLTGTVSTGTNIPINFYFAKGNSTNTITSFADAGGGDVTATTSSVHGYTTGDRIIIEDTTNYDSEYSITVLTTTTFSFTATWVATETGSHYQVLEFSKGSNTFTSTSTKNTSMVSQISLVMNDQLFLCVENTGNAGEWETNDIQSIYVK